MPFIFEWFYYYGLYNRKTRTAMLTSVHENLYITLAQSRENHFPNFFCTVRKWNPKVLSKKMVILDIYGIKAWIHGMNFYRWISYNFFRVCFKRLSVYQVFRMFFLVCLLFCIQAVQKQVRKVREWEFFIL